MPLVWSWTYDQIWRFAHWEQHNEPIPVKLAWKSRPTPRSTSANHIWPWWVRGVRRHGHGSKFLNQTQPNPLMLRPNPTQPITLPTLTQPNPYHRHYNSSLLLRTQAVTMQSIVKQLSRALKSCSIIMSQISVLILSLWFSQKQPKIDHDKDQYNAVIYMFTEVRYKFVIKYKDRPNPTQPNPQNSPKISTQPNPTQPNPWVDPTHVHVWVYVYAWTTKFKKWSNLRFLWHRGDSIYRPT